MDKFSFEHKTLDINTYESLFMHCTQSNLLQSAGYGEAKCSVEGFEIIRKGVYTSNTPIALYQILIKHLPLIGVVARINRGPLYLQDISTFVENNVSWLYHSLYNEWVIKKRFFLQIATNLPDDCLNYETLKESGFIPDTADKWQSGWINLNQSEEELRKGLLQKWRNMLNKAEKLRMELRVIKEHKELDLLLKEYDNFMEAKNFQGISSNLIKAMHCYSPDMIHALIALKNKQLVGAVVIAKHGDTCTYLVGFTSNDGRKNNANYYLLWNGILHCKHMGFRWFDIGGIDDINAPGIAHFKRGLGIIPYRLVGEFEGRLGFRNRVLSTLKRCYAHGVGNMTFVKKLPWK